MDIVVAFSEFNQNSESQNFPISSIKNTNSYQRYLLFPDIRRIKKDKCRGHSGRLSKKEMALAILPF